MRDTRCGYRTAYSRASMVPQECPNNTTDSSLKYRLTFSISAMSEASVTSSGLTPTADRPRFSLTTLMRPIECVMDSNSKANRGRPQSFNPLLRFPEVWNPTLHALELGSATGFTKETIIPQKPPPHDNAGRWRDAGYSIRHTSRCYSSLPNRSTPGLSIITGQFFESHP